MIRRLALAAATCAIALAHAAGDKPSIPELFGAPLYDALAISPDGRQVATLAYVGGRQNVAVFDVATHKLTPVTTFTERDIAQVRWVNSKRLVFLTGASGPAYGHSRGGGLFAIDSDGSNMRELGGTDRMLERGVRQQIRPLLVVRTLPGESADVIAQEFLYDPRFNTAQPGALLRIDSRTGHRKVLSWDKPETADDETWIVDGKGVARALVAETNDHARVYYRDGDTDPWRRVAQFSAFDAHKWVPLAMAADGRTLYVSSWVGRDKAAIERFDPARGTFEVLAEHPQVDLKNLVMGRDGPLGVTYEADRGGTAWFDPGVAEVQAAIDKALPGKVNFLAPSEDLRRFVVTSFSDVAPPTFHVFDRASGKLEWLADSKPWIDPARMSPMTPVHYAARDGLDIPGYLSIPRGAGERNLPLVVMVHGGPWVDGDLWSFNPEVQFFTSRGYAVLQPNYRGTTRYGWKHFASSFGQWGLAMQDDIADGVRWAIAQGVADPRRICIYGASYGGYAVLMGLARTPGLFRCGIDYMGITDLKLYATASWSDYAYSAFATHEMDAMIGDVVDDRKRLQATSPVELAARIKAPVLMAYALEDRRVVPEHGFRMKAALEAAGNPPQWILVEGEGHGLRTMKNEEMFYGAVEKFLAVNLADRRPGEVK